MTAATGRDSLAAAKNRRQRLRSAASAEGMWMKIIAWAFTGVMVSALPVLYAVLQSAYATGAVAWNFVFARGDGLLIAGAVCGAALGELATARGSSFKVTRGLLAGIAITVLVCSTLWYAQAAVLAGTPAGAAGSSITTTGSILSSLGAFVVGVNAIIFVYASDS